jgi:DNA-binding CsgD family transcriptional regulator
MSSDNMGLSLELLESIADLHLGNDTMDEWLLRLSKITGSAGAYCVNWRIGNAGHATNNGSDEKQTFPADWLASVENMIARSELKDTGMLDELTRTDDLTAKNSNNPINDPNLMIGVMKSAPVYTLIVLRCDDRPEGWLEVDRGYFKRFLPVLLKAHLLHKELTISRNHLEIANKVLDSSPRGIIAISSTAKIIKANTLSLKMIASNSCFSNEHGKLLITEPTIDLEMEAKLAEVNAAPLKSLEGFIWNRSFLNAADNRTFQIALSAHAVENWSLEAGGDDRFLVIFINELGAEPKPTPEQLKDFHNLTTAQARLVASLLDGHSIKSAAEDLHLSIHTVRSHLRSIYKRLGVENNADLLRRVSSTLVNFQSKD